MARWHAIEIAKLSSKLRAQERRNDGRLPPKIASELCFFTVFSQQIDIKRKNVSVDQAFGELLESASPKTGLVKTPPSLPNPAKSEQAISTTIACCHS